MVSNGASSWCLSPSVERVLPAGRRRVSTGFNNACHPACLPAGRLPGAARGEAGLHVGIRQGGGRGAAVCACSQWCHRWQRDHLQVGGATGNLGQCAALVPSHPGASGAPGRPTGDHLKGRRAPCPLLLPSPPHTPHATTAQHTPPCRQRYDSSLAVPCCYPTAANLPVPPSLPACTACLHCLPALPVLLAWLQGLLRHQRGGALPLYCY